MIRKFAVVLSSLAALTGAGVGPAYASPAQAVRPQVTFEVCAQAGSGYCLNDWGGGGSGTAVRMYTSGTANDEFNLTPLSGYGSNAYEIQPANRSLCVGTDSVGNANLGACPPSGGTGHGSNIWIRENDSCIAGGDYGFYLVNTYWTNRNGLTEYLVSGGSVGAQATITASGPSCWGQKTF